jgi:hypothetical protein
MKEIREDRTKWKDILLLWIGRINVKILLEPKVIYRLNAIPIKILIAFFFVFTEIGKIIPELIRNHNDLPRQ